MILPFQDQPEYHCRKSRGIGIDLTLDSREPERIAEGIDEGSHQTGCLDGNRLGECQFIPIADKQLPCEVCDTPE